MPNAICLHEEDYGLLWKHIDWRTDYTEVRRSRRLVVSFIATVGNYEYGFYWYFYQDGTIAARGQADRRHLQRRHARPARRRSWGDAGRAAGLRADPPALLQRAPGHDGRWAEQLGLRSQHRDRPERPRESARQRLPRAKRRCWRRKPRRSGSSIRCRRATGRSSTRRRSIGSGEPVGYKLDAGRQRPAVRRAETPSVLKRAGVHDQAPVGHAVRAARALRRGRLPEPARRRRRPAGVHAARPVDRGHRRGGLVHVRRAPRRAPRGLAGHAGLARSAST